MKKEQLEQQLYETWLNNIEANGYRMEDGKKLSRNTVDTLRSVNLEAQQVELVVQVVEYICKEKPCVS